MWGSYGDTSQNSIQLFLLIISLICVPLMLLPKPLYEIYCSRKGKGRKVLQSYSDEKESDPETFKSEELIEDGEQSIRKSINVVRLSHSDSQGEENQEEHEDAS